MKKLFIILTLLCVMMSAPLKTEAKVVLVADCGAVNFVGKIKNIINGNIGLKNGFRITDCRRFSELDIPKEHLYAWRFQYGFLNASAPDGDLILWADENGYVKVIKMLHNIPDLKNSTFIMFEKIIFQALGLNPQEIDKIDKSYSKYNYHYVSVAWCAAMKRQYAVMFYPRIRMNEPSVSDWGVIITANDDVNETLSMAQEILFTECDTGNAWVK